MKVKYTKEYTPFVDNTKFKFTLGNIYDVIEYKISSQKMFIIKDDDGNQIKYSDNSRMIKFFEIVENESN